jgi:phosphoribosylpyrophosphate synthetase
MLSTLATFSTVVDVSATDFVVGPDRGRYDDCRDLASSLGCSFDLLLKVRVGHTDTSRLLGGANESIAHQKVILFDDEMTRGETALHALDALAGVGATRVTFTTVYDFSSESIRSKVLSHPAVSAMVTTNLGRPADDVEESRTRYTVLDAAPLAAEELRRYV